MTPAPHAARSVAVICTALLVFGGCAQNAPHREAPMPTLQPPSGADKPVDYPGLHNVVDYAPGIYSGSAPQGDQGFASLTALGIKTVLSVDGTLPEVDRAEAHGLRYVHLPIGYDGVPEARGKEIAAVIEKLPKPLYIHCHHGKHRSAGAAATGCVITGLLTPAAAIARMHVSGTAADYDGLYDSARQAQPLPASALPAHPEEFPSSAEMTGMVETMVAIDNAFDDLKVVRGEKWQVPASHPDLVPARTAGRLHDLLSGLANDSELQQKPADFHQHLQQSVDAAQRLQRAIAANDAGASESAYKTLNDSCKACHRIYRDR